MLDPSLPQTRRLSAKKIGQKIHRPSLSTRADSGEGLTTVSAELFRSQLSLLSSAKTHLASGNQESKCQGFNHLTIVAGINPCWGCSKRAQSPIALSPSNTPEWLKYKP
jgi:hypothetical protein